MSEGRQPALAGTLIGPSLQASQTPATSVTPVLEWTIRRHGTLSGSPRRRSRMLVPHEVAVRAAVALTRMAGFAPESVTVAGRGPSPSPSAPCLRHLQQPGRHRRADPPQQLVPPWPGGYLPGHRAAVRAGQFPRDGWGGLLHRGHPAHRRGSWPAMRNLACWPSTPRSAPPWAARPDRVVHRAGWPVLVPPAVPAARAG